MSYNYAGWLEDHATDAARASRTGDLQTDEAQDYLEGDRAPEPPQMATVDALEAILERTYHLLNRPALHSHHCRRCSMLRPCLQQPCAYRATDHESEWVCGECLPGEEAP